VRAFVTAGAGFLLAVLWFDLMFDVQVLGSRDPGEEVLASIAGYYRRVTTKARPMNRLVALAMVGTIAAIIIQLARQSGPAWVAWTSLALVIAPVTLAARRTVPAAVRLGSRTDPLAQQSALAKAICRDHLFCAASIASVLIVQLGLYYV
jgi:hypothetical protein